VLRAGEGRALVEIEREEACGHCAAKDLCHALGSRGRLRVEADNPLGALEGQLVEVSPVRSVGLRAAFFVYLLPAAMFVVAVAVSTELWRFPPWASALAGFGALALAWAVARAFDRRVTRNPEFRLRIVRLIGEDGAEPGAGARAAASRAAASRAAASRPDGRPPAGESR